MIVAAGLARQVASTLLALFVRLDLTGGRESIHIVIINPMSTSRTHPEVMFQFTLGSIPEGKQYVQIATVKARMSFREQMDTRMIVSNFAHKLLPGDVVYSGGVFLHGIAVGVSGLPSYLDEIIAYAVAVVWRIIAIVNKEKYVEDPTNDDEIFLP